MMTASQLPTRDDARPPHPGLRRSRALMVLAACAVVGWAPGQARAGGLRAGVAKVDVTHTGAGPINDRLFVRALVVKDDVTTAVIITVDAVAIGEIGPIKNDYLPKVRARLEAGLGIKAGNVLVNASHCHGIVCEDVAERTVRAVQEAASRMVAVKVGAGAGHEDRIMENRRLKLKGGKEADVRHAYSLPPDDEVVGAGPVDPEIGVLRLDREDGRPLAVVYNFACHPIQGVPGGGITADLTGFASGVIEEGLGGGAIALFLQGCGGDVNPASYKDVNNPRDAEPLGTRLGLSTLRALRAVETGEDGRLKVIRETIALPRAELDGPIAAREAEQQALLGSLKGTSLNLKTFLPLTVKYAVSGEHPSYSSHRYLSERARGRDDLDRLDAENRANMRDYVENIRTMERLTRSQANLALMRKHRAENLATGQKTVEVEVLALRIGEFVLATFPGELTVQTGLDIKGSSPHALTFVAGYTNGYIYYAPTAEQLKNVGGAQEDSDCILAPEWQALYESKVAEMMKGL
jgi:hypothetical protein